MKKKIINYSILFFFSFIFLFFIQLIIFGSNLDFYWNYNNSLQISNGLIPYNEINILTTPLFHYIIAFFLTVIGKNIYVYIGAMTILKLIHYYILSRIVLLYCKKKKIEERKEYFLFTFFLGFIITFRIYYEYNFFALMLLSLITYIELKELNKNKQNILIGILAGLAFLSKQSIGILIIAFILIKPLLFINDKKSILYRFLGILIPISIFIIYLLLTNSFDGFINYSILGISTFKNSVSYIDATIEVFNISVIKGILALVLILAFVIFIICQLYQLFTKKYDKDKKLLLFYTVISFSCFYPLRDIHHLLPLILSFIPLFIISNINNIDKFVKRINYKGFRIVLIVFFILSSIMPLNMYINIYNGNNDDYNILKNNYHSINGMVVDRILESNINDIIKYEKDMNDEGINTIILNKNAVLFHLAQDKYYKDYDLFMKGNLGYNGEERLIDEIKESSNTVYLINLDDQNNNMIQLPDKVYNYVINNYNKTDQILYYSVYSK